jgi:hypothetical protein
MDSVNCEAGESKCNRRSDCANSNEIDSEPIKKRKNCFIKEIYLDILSVK